MEQADKNRKKTVLFEINLLFIIRNYKINNISQNKNKTQQFLHTYKNDTIVLKSDNTEIINDSSLQTGRDRSLFP